MKQLIKIGTRESQLAVWQATLVKTMLEKNGVESELIYIKSEGDVDTVTPLYELGVQGIFTKTLDAALINKRIDIAVHSQKDVPTKLANGLKQAAVLKRASSKDIFVYKNDCAFLDDKHSNGIIATSSTRRIAQWLHRYPNHTVENLRGNVNTRLRKINEHNWNGAIFASAGLERIGLRPENSVDLDWMLPAPAQGAISIVCREDDEYSFESCNVLSDINTALCTKIERDFLRELMGGCSTPISALAVIEGDAVLFKGNICSPDGKKMIEIEKSSPMPGSNDLGVITARKFLEDDAVKKIMVDIRNAAK